MTDTTDPIEPLQPPDPVEPLQPPDPIEPPEPEPEPFSQGPPPLPTPMLVLGGDLPPASEPEPVEVVDHGTCRCGGKFDADGWCTECGQRRPDPRHHFSARPSPWVGAVCDRGLRHTDNEDAMAVWAQEDDPTRVALVVCDGVTTATRSAEASLAAAFAAIEVLSTSDDEPTSRLSTATAAAARAVEQVGEEFPDSAPSCTYVAAVIEDGTATVGTIGDSRAYWMPDEGGPVLLTRDDSLAQEQIESGVDRVSAESGPLGHTITRWLGLDSPDQEPSLVTQDVRAPGWLLLCSDGLWNYASEPDDLLAVLRAAERVGPDPLTVAQALIDWANDQGGGDNITAALLRTGDTAYPQDARAEEPTGATHQSPAELPDVSVAADSGQDGNHG
ncbi:MAG: serine/threonine-protein phosphatase [Ornithinimicrobium sp.]|uniref:PP2C family protein-serine/threonine phosphatase n=1 Tax=Ornithinimicrobium sp. TaxID=1977084 RepID=UPI0026DF7DCC|nr:PP2C family serine/threonine-protein phosphatase [Ornithinimicrobium sp.]MDO5740157.1 serine/threonine-protein phosphatase [Ornithinimicrobium sp.]